MRKKAIKRKMKAHKVVAMFMLALATVDFATPVMAAVDNVTSGNVLNKVNGNYGADLRDVTGATVTTDYTNATITNTQTNSVLNWNNLNTAPNQTLNYVMKDGQLSLNKVVGTSASTFAGGINAEHGHVIISNPNGMIFENGSYVNANALTVTTHNADIDYKNDLRFITNDKNSSITIKGGNLGTQKVRLTVAKDLNIISDNININNADITAGNSHLYTADGVTFHALNSNDVTAKAHATSNNNLGKIDVNNSKMAVLDKNTGKITITTKGDVNINKSTVNGKIDIDATKIAKNANVTLDKVTSDATVKASGNKVAMYNSTVDNVDLNSKTDVKMQNVNTTGVAVSEIKAGRQVDVRKSSFKSVRAAAADITFTDTNLNNANVQATKNVKVGVSDSRNTASINNSTVVAGSDINVNNTIISDSLMVADSNINADKATISNTEMNVGRNIYAGSSIITDSILNSSNDILVSGATISNSSLSAVKDLKLQGTTLDNSSADGRYAFLNDAILQNDTTVSVATVTGNVYNDNSIVENLTVNNSTLKSKNNMNLKNAKLTNATLETTKNVNIDTNSDVSLVGVNIAGNLNIDNAGHVVISNSKVADDTYIPNISKSNSVTDYDKTMFDTDYFENIINNYGRDFGKGTKLSNIDGNVSISNAKSSIIVNSVIGGDLKTKDIYYGSNLIKSSVGGNYNPTRVATTIVNVYDSFIDGDFELKYANQVVDTPTVLPDLSGDKPVVIDNPTVLPDLSENKPVVIDTPSVSPDLDNKGSDIIASNDNKSNNNNYGFNKNSNDRDSLNMKEEHNKRHYGHDINTKFEKKFSPKGFAAGEDQLSEMKSKTKSSIEKHNNGFRVNKSFHAY